MKARSNSWACCRAPAVNEHLAETPQIGQLASASSTQPLPGPVEHPAVRAWRDGTLGFSFSGGGFLIPYYCGFVHQLAHMGVIRPGHTHLAGSSAGSLIAACVSTGITTHKVSNRLFQGGGQCCVTGLICCSRRGLQLSPAWCQSTPVRGGFSTATPTPTP